MMKKYLPYIIGYVIYASFVLMCLSYEHDDRDYQAMFIWWLITAPLIAGCIFYFIKKRYFTTDKVEKTEDPSPQENKENKPLFIQTWTLLNFARECGPKMQVREYTNNLTGESFKLCVFIDNYGKETTIRFLSQLGELTPSEISARKNDLKVGRMSNGKYYLYDKNPSEWETIDLGL